MSPSEVPEVNLSEFAMLIGSEQIVSGRYSVLLAGNPLGGFLSGVQNPATIIREIELLEKNALGQFKRPIKNRHPLLKGLWHKHYPQNGLASFAKNVEKVLNQCGMPFLEKKIQDAKDGEELRYITPDDVPTLVDDVISGNRQLAKRQKLSDEWIVSAQYEDQNYYLTIATHDSTTHDRVREQINEVCCKEFPF